MVWDNVFAVLEIEPTKDKKEIKKAYAKLVRKYHPEEYPEQWEKIHHAYESALHFAENDKENVEESSVLHVDTEEKTEKSPVLVLKTGKNKQQTRQYLLEQSSSEILEMNILFENISQLSNEQQEQKVEIWRQEIQKAIDEIKRMSEKKQLNPDEWKNFFGQHDILSILCTGKFLYALGDCFRQRKINDQMYKLLKEQLKMIEEYVAEKDKDLKNIGISAPLGYARSKIEEAYRKNRRIIKNSKVFLLILLVLGITVWICTISAGNKPEEIEEEQQVSQEETQQSLTPQDVEKAIEMIRMSYDITGTWTKEGIISFISAYSSVLQENLFDTKLNLQEEIAIWDWREEGRTEETIYEMHELTVSEDTQENYHIYAFCVTSEKEQSNMALLCDLKALGFSEDCSIYYYDGTDYIKIPMLSEKGYDTPDSDAIYSITLLEQRTFLIDTHTWDEKKLYPIVLVEDLQGKTTDEEAMRKTVADVVERGMKK